MTHRGRYSTGIVRCPKCGLLHLLVYENGRLVVSVPMTRDEWALLIGMYGDHLAAENETIN